MADQRACELLRSLGLEKYIPNFEKEEVTFDLFHGLNEQDFVRLVPAMGPRRKFQQWVTDTLSAPALRTAATQPLQTSPPPNSQPSKPNGVAVSSNGLPNRIPAQAKSFSTNLSAVPQTYSSPNSFAPSSGRSYPPSSAQTISPVPAPVRAGPMTTGRGAGEGYAGPVTTGRGAGGGYAGPVTTGRGAGGGYAGPVTQQQSYPPHSSGPSSYRPTTMMGQGRVPVQSAPFQVDVEKLMGAQGQIGLFNNENFGEWAKTIQIDTFGDNLQQIALVKSFSQFVQSPQLGANLRTLRHQLPTPIQQHTLAWFQTGRDLMISARTGSGKTAAFLVPVLNYCLSQNSNNVSLRPRSPLVIIFEPTRELAQQTFTELQKLSFQTPIQSACLIGQVPWRPLANQFNQGVHVAVCTIGRAVDFYDRGYMTLNDVKLVVIDEADRLLDTATVNASRIESFLSNPGPNRMTMLFAATLPNHVVEMAARILKDNHVYLRDHNVDGINPNVTQLFVDVTHCQYIEARFQMMLEVLEQYVKVGEQALIFVNTKKQCHELSSFFDRVPHFASRCIHAEILPECRQQNIEDFRTRKYRLLIATDLLSRGIDLPNLKYVIQFELPRNLQDYITRVGRTGRLMSQGTAISFFNRGRDAEIEQTLICSLREHGQRIPDFFQDAEEFHATGFDRE